MVGLPNHLSNLLHPSRHASSRASPPQKAEADAEGDMDADDDEQDDDTSAPQVAGKTYCSGEIFSLFKMMAAGKGNQKSLSEEVDSDESEGDEPVSQPRIRSKGKSPSPSPAEQGGMRHSGSSATMKIGEALYDDDDDDEDDESRTVVDEHDSTSEGLETWRKQHAQSNSDMDAQGQRLAGGYIAFWYLGPLTTSSPPRQHAVRSSSNNSVHVIVSNCC